MSENYLIPSPGDDFLTALGRAWWNGLYLGGQMMSISRNLGLDANARRQELGHLRRAMIDALPRPPTSTRPPSTTSASGSSG